MRGGSGRFPEIPHQGAFRAHSGNFHHPAYIVLFMIQPIKRRTQFRNPGVGGFFFLQYPSWQFRKTTGSKSDTSQPQNFNILFLEILTAHHAQTMDFRGHADLIKLCIDQPEKRRDLKMDVQLCQDFIRMGTEMHVRRDQIHIIRIQRKLMFLQCDYRSGSIILIQPSETSLQILIIPFLGLQLGH